MGRWRLYRHDLGDYMQRWIFQTPWGTLRLHHILRSDDDRALHDHPWSFCSLILWGGYTEVTPSGRRWYGPGSVLRRAACDAHRLELGRPAWTVVMSGPRVREWGFHTAGGWVFWRDFDDKWKEGA